jgi:hypothetical protein
MDLESVPGEIYNVLGFSERLVARCRVRIATTSRTATVIRDVPTIPTFQTEERRSDVSPEQLADHWMIGLESARRTLKHTTQRFLRSAFGVAPTLSTLQGRSNLLLASTAGGMVHGYSRGTV